MTSQALVKVPLIRGVERGVRRGKRSGACAPMGPVMMYLVLFIMQKSIINIRNQRL